MGSEMCIRDSLIPSSPGWHHALCVYTGRLHRTVGRTRSQTTGQCPHCGERLRVIADITEPHRLTLRRPLSPALTIHRRENNSLACRSQPGPQPSPYPRAIQTSETTPCVFLQSDGKARYASYPRFLIYSIFCLTTLFILMR